MKSQIKLDELLLSYEKALADYGLSYATRLLQLQCASRVIKVHENHGAEYLTDSLVAVYTAEITERYNTGVMNHHTYHNRLRELSRFINYANTGAVVLPYPLKGSRSELNTVFSQVADEFIETIPHHNTRNDARWVAHKYFLWLERQGHNDLTRVSAEEIQKFLLDCSKTLMLNSMRDVKLFMKKLYSFLYGSGRAGSDYNALLSFTVNREAKIYPALPRDDIAKMLGCIDRKTKTGKRNYAIMLLGTVLGLRACDIVSLKRTDIDWQKGEIKVVQSKTANTVVLPLTEDVSDALQDYILNARPDANERRIFLRIKAPHTPICSAVTIGEIYEDCCKKAGLPLNKRFHNLRRSLATSMITNGVSVYVAAQGLGDRNFNSIKPYIGLDTTNLKICALPFDGIAPEDSLGGARQ